MCGCGPTTPGAPGLLRSCLGRSGRPTDTTLASDGSRPSTSARRPCGQPHGSNATISDPGPRMKMCLAAGARASSGPRNPEDWQSLDPAVLQCHRHAPVVRSEHWTLAQGDIEHERPGLLATACCCPWPALASSCQCLILRASVMRGWGQAFHCLAGSPWRARATLAFAADPNFPSHCAATQGTEGSVKRDFQVQSSVPGSATQGMQLLSRCTAPHSAAPGSPTQPPCRGHPGWAWDRKACEHGWVWLWGAEAAVGFSWGPARPAPATHWDLSSACGR